MRFTGNLATRTYINHRLVNGIIAVLLAVLLLALVWNVKRLFSGIGERDSLSSEIGKVENRLNVTPAGVTAQEYQALQAGIRFHNDIIARKTADWSGLLEKLEQITPPDVALTALEPDSRTGEIKVEAESRSFDGVRGYLGRLESSRHFSNVQLLSHRDQTVGDNNRGVRFVVTFRVAGQ